MAYRTEKGGDVIITGWEAGIADDPFTGISDIRNINLISIPKEASVNFKTFKITAPVVLNATIASSDAATELVTLGGGATRASLGLEGRMAIVFSATTIAGVTTNTTYWIVDGPASNNFYLYSDYQQTSLVNITSNGTGTFSTIDVGTITNFAYDPKRGYYFGVDTTGRVWGTAYLTATNFYWTYTGNQVPTQTYTNGNGLVYYQASDGTGYLFLFHNGSVDYTPTANTLLTWVYQWNPSTGANLGYAAIPTQRLKTLISIPNSHKSILAPDNKIYYCDANYIGRFYQTAPGTAFDPTNTTTYTFDQTAVLPFNDIANCLAVLGNNMYIGAQSNIIYPWDTVAQLPNYPIFIPEYNTVQLVTVDTNIFIFSGNRGRVYVTNGSNAQLYKKVPDHLSGTIEPYFQWGGASSNKNQLYFSMLATTNTGGTISQYGGVWAIDLDTKAIRLTNKLSYNTYAGYASAIIPNFGTNPAGTGLYIGWNSNASTTGIDATFNSSTGLSSPYTGGESIVAGDLIPIGTVLKPTTNGRVEFKLSVPLVTGESVKLQYRQSFADAFTDLSSTVLFNTAGVFSGVYQNVPFQNSQWIQIQAVLTSTATNPSFCRLTEIRLGS